MKVVEKFTEIIVKESSASREDKKSKEFAQLLNEMKKAGLIKKPEYNLPLVDTIGKTYYSSINKRC